MAPNPTVVFGSPLLRLLAVNLATGAAAAALLLGGLVAFNLFGLRDLILADHSPGAALGLLLFGLLITFGSTAMGTAVMALGGSDKAGGRGHDDGGGRGGNGRRDATPDRTTLAPARAKASPRKDFYADLNFG